MARSSLTCCTLMSEATDLTRAGPPVDPPTVPGVSAVHSGARRIQRKRAKGWRLPAGAVCVTRPGKWGNPWVHDGTKAGRVIAWKLFEVHIKDRRDPWPGWVDLIGYPSDEEIRAELAGRDLACWCPVDSPCHGDVLLAIANIDDRSLAVDRPC